MTTYNAAAVADTVIAFKKGITLQQGRALRDNPIAIAEGASGAPKIASKSVGGLAASGTLTFTGLGAFGGIKIEGFIEGTGSPGRDLTLSLSDDGVTFYGAAIIVDASAAFGSFSMYLDFATGGYKIAYLLEPGIPMYASGTITGSSLAVTDVRLDAAPDTRAAVIAYPNGGESAS